MADNLTVRAGTTTVAAVARDDRIFPETRVVAALIPLFLVAAFIILYIFPNDTDRLFAWTIRPSMTPIMIGAGYTSGTYFFVRLAAGGKWHWYTHGLPAITAFTWFMALATFLHWDRFHHDQITFYIWLGLYVVTPILVPIIWLRNRVTDPITPEAGEVIVPSVVRLLMGIIGGGLTLLAVFMFLFPEAAISIWPWQLTPLTARVLGGWFALLGVAELGLARDPRWSSWRILLVSQAIALALIALGVVRAWSDFNQSNPLTWVFVAGTTLPVLGIIGLFLYLGRRRPLNSPQ